MQQKLLCIHLRESCSKSSNSKSNLELTDFSEKIKINNN